MTDLVARLVAAIQQVRTSEPHDVDCYAPSWFACNCPRTERVDARLAACVEAMMEAAIGAPEGRRVHAYTLRESGLAAFLAAAAQKETT